MNWLTQEFRTPMTSLFDSIVTEFFKPVDPFRSFSSDVKKRAYPKVDVRKDGKDLIVEAAVPFVKKEGLSVILRDKSLIISGEGQKDEIIESTSFIKKELVRTSFSRTFPLQEDLYEAWESGGGSISADLQDGLLTVRLKGFFENPQTLTQTVRKVLVA